jgi:D-threonine aldolase
MNWYNIDNINEIDSPALVIYVDRVKENIATAIKMVGNVVKLRPHVKTHKCMEVAQLMMDAGISKFKCATIAEAEMLGICKAKDVLLAYQPTGPKLLRFVKLIKHFPETQFSCLTDNEMAANEMDRIFSNAGLCVPVYIDLNIGQNRTGIEPEKAIDLYLACSQMKGIKPIGLHAYDGHLRDKDFAVRKENCDACFEKVLWVKKALIEKGMREPIVVAGGSPSFSIHCKREDIECSPGTFIFWDKGYSELCPEQNFLTAALVISRVISFPTENTICVDLGHKSIAAENDISRRVYFLNAPELKALGQSEEHLVLEIEENHNYKIGDLLYGLPIHICPTVALYERAIIINNHIAVGEWKIVARVRRISI